LDEIRGKALVLMLLALVACHRKAPVDIPAEGASAFPLASTAFEGGGTIPVLYTCEGQNLSPPLSWTGAPARDALVLVMLDRDAPGTFFHWIAVLPPGTRGLAEGRLPGGATEGANSFGHRGYNGPCPPPGDGPHHYVFHLFALPEGRLPDLSGSPADVYRAAALAAAGAGQTTGTYARG
jgi:Raf kinase inhibitor-like YbhB/YbcL family protein